ncbi:MAG: PRD domain-containing protein [Leptolinea sp.]|jgi:lichenan operon transcriptional antiterminator|nr:PRD domain-containing protein [Leptolinea sp.]
MRNKNVEILTFLSSQESWVTSFALSAALNVSVRTIKSYIAEVNADTPNLIESSHSGFRITNKKLLAEILARGSENTTPQTADDRRKFILKKLLLEKNEYDLDDLADELSISPSTLQNELPKLKSLLAEYELSVRTKNNIASIVGPEVNKKKIISRLIYDDSKDSFLSIKLMQSYLPNFDLVAVKDIITDALREHHYFMDDFSLMNLVLHYAITMERKLAQGEIDQSEDLVRETRINAHVKEIVKEMSEKIAAKFNLAFDDTDLYNFALLIMTRVISNTINKENTDRLSEIVGDDVVRIVALMQTRTKENYNISITNEDFTVRFSLHIKNLLTRLQNNIILRNPQMLEIKNSYPFIYDVSVFITNIITQETGYEISEDEISYIALHIGVLIEERKVIKYEVRAILVFPQYYLSSHDMVQRISAAFGNNILITGVAASIDELESYSDYDLILTTIPLPGCVCKPCVLISSFLINKDILAISNKVEEVLTARTKAKVESKLKIMLKEELFFVNADFKDQDDVINVLGDKLYNQGYVGSDFKDRLFERENVSSSAYNNIAMPHPLEMSALKSVIAVSIHPNAIRWNDSKVNIVFLLAINILDRLFFKDIFDFITDVISEDRKLRSLLDVKSYDEFIETLVSYAR